MWFDQRLRRRHRPTGGSAGNDAEDDPHFGNAAGLTSLARHLLTLAQPSAPAGSHRDFDDYCGWFEEGTVARPSSTHLLTPVECVVTLRDFAEFINQLWGIPTRGGRLYPAPAERDVLFIGWNANGSMTLAPADHLTAGMIRLYDIDHYAIARAVFSREPPGGSRPPLLQHSIRGPDH